MPTIGVAIIGAGAIALANHLPGLGLCPEARITVVCDANPEVLARAVATTGAAGVADWRDVLARTDVQAVIIATPNHLHAPIAIAAAQAGKHILCEKPIAMDGAESLALWRAGEIAGVRHMTAFTYRFVPAMRYAAALVAQGAIGTPRHFRAQRLQDWGTRPLGWRQQKRFAATGEMGDMLSHRIDYGHLLVGRIDRLVASAKILVPERGGLPADVEDWVALLVDFAGGATGVLESSKLASGCGEGAASPDLCEVNGTTGTVAYRLSRPHEILRTGSTGGGLRPEPVPREYLTWPGSPRDPTAGDPLATFRYDQDVEFIRAIVDGRPCVPSFADGHAAQVVMDAALASAAKSAWITLDYTTP